MIQIKQAFNAALSKHNGNPKAVMGRIAGEVMVRQHRPETAWTIDLLDIQPADTVLEVGCGAGQGIKLAAEKAKDGRIIGIDISEEMVRAATRRNALAVNAGHVAILQGNITTLPFKDQQFEKIMTIHTLYFWLKSPGLSQALGELYRVLKPGGRVVITLSTGKTNARGEVEVWEQLQSAIEEQVMPYMQRQGFSVVHLEQGPNLANIRVWQ